MDLLKEENRRIKTKYRELVIQYKVKDKHIKALHEKVVDLDETCRKMKTDQSLHSSESRTEKNLPDIEIHLQNIEQQKQQKLEEEHKLKSKFKETSYKLTQAKDKVEQLSSTLKDQDRQFRINVLKAKEMKRLSNLRFRSVGRLKYLPPIEDTLPKHTSLNQTSTSKSSERIQLKSHQSRGSSSQYVVSTGKNSAQEQVDESIGTYDLSEYIPDVTSPTNPIHEQMELLEDSALDNI